MSGDRGAPIVVSIVFFGLAWAYMLEWAPLVRHKQYWITPVDIWLFRNEWGTVPSLS